MLKPPTQPVSVDAATVIFDLMSDVDDYLDHNDPRHQRLSLAQQLLNGDLTAAQALAYAADIVDV